MIKLILLKDDEISVRKEFTRAYCDFCGDNETAVFTSSFGDEVQVCYDCIRQLHKHLP